MNVMGISRMADKAVLGAAGLGTAALVAPDAYELGKTTDDRQWLTERVALATTGAVLAGVVTKGLYSFPRMGFTSPLLELAGAGVTGLAAGYAAGAATGLITR